MKKQLLIALSTALLSSSLLAAGGGAKLEKAPIDVHDEKSLQNGLRYFMNYCSGCHSLDSSRYNRVAKDAGMSVVPTDDSPEAAALADANAKLMQENIVFTTDKEGKPVNLGSLMHSSINKEDAANWFGAAPPDLSLVGRSRGADWIYTYLKSFYLDPKRPVGVNNTAFPNVGMPHVLWELQGWQTLEEHNDGHGHVEQKLHLSEPGSMSPAEYDIVVRDLTNFLTYVSEPAQLHRTTYGIFTLIFLAFFTVLAYMLKKEYWKDIH